MTRRLSAELERPLTRMRGRAAWAERVRLLTGCPGRPPLRRWWLQGYLEAVRVSTSGSRINSFAVFPVEPPRAEAIWTPVERDAVLVGRDLGLPHAVLARLLGRSAGAVKIEACRLGKRAAPGPALARAA